MILALEISAHTAIQMQWIFLNVHDREAASVQVCKTVTVSFTDRCKAPYLKILESACSPKESVGSLSILVLCDKNQT